MRHERQLPDEPQLRVWAGAHMQAPLRARTRLATQNQADAALLAGQSRRPPSVPCSDGCRQGLHEGAARTVWMGAPKAPSADVKPDGYAG
jgi:hypothetical protein